MFINLTQLVTDGTIELNIDTPRAALPASCACIFIQRLVDAHLSMGQNTLW